MSDFSQSYARIIKQEKQADGTLKVYGKATDDSIDIDLQICDPAWLAQAMPDWFTTGGNIREQHSNIAAGVATDYEVKGAEHFITALVVDPTSIKKVENNVLKGFSIGIRSPRVIRDDVAKNGRIVGGQIVEVSLVDRPANPNAKLMLAKAAESGELMAVEQNSAPNPKNVFGHLVKDAEVADPIEEVTEEIIEAQPEVPLVDGGDDEDEFEDKGLPIAEVEELINGAKSAVASLLKFDQATYDAATQALYDLVIVEANEGKAGSDERESIKELLHSIKHLYHWYEGEAENGEVAGVVADDLNSAEGIYMSADVVVCECGCDDCKADKGCDSKMCKCDGMKSADAEETVDAVEPEAEVKVSLDAEQVSEIVEKAKAAASEFVATEIETLTKAFEAEQGKAIKLEQDLAEALAKSAAGGPKRSALVAGETKINEWLEKAAKYARLAKSTDDVTLVKGYKALAEDAELKAQKVQKGMQK